MSYDVGTNIDLGYLNKKVEVASRAEKKSFQEAVGNAYDVGTSIVFKFTPQGLKSARRIPVVFA